MCFSLAGWHFLRPRSVGIDVQLLVVVIAPISNIQHTPVDAGDLPHTHN